MKDMRTFFTIWAGQVVSIIGSGMTVFALGVWLVEETGRATPFALVALFATIPQIALAPIAGAYVDRLSRRTVMIVADTVSALGTVLLMVLFFSGSLAIWHVYLVAFISSCAAAFQEPAYTASVTMIVPKEHFGRASGMMSAAQAIQLLIAPLLGGLIYAVFGFGAVVIIDVVTFLFAVGTLMVVHIPDPERSAESEQAAAGGLLKEAFFGFRYILDRRGLLTMMIYFAVINFAANLTAVLIGPMVLAFGDATTLGVVQAVGGVGMMAGSIAMGIWGGPPRKMVGVYGFIGLFGFAFALSGLAPSMWVVALGFFILMGAVPIASGCAQVIWQSKVQPDVQGRVFSARAMLARGLMPLAFLLAGPLADGIFEPLMVEGGALAVTPLGALVGVGAGRGIAVMFLLGGVVLTLTTLVAVASPRLRNVEEELPDVVPDEAHAAPEAAAATPEPAAI